MNRFTMKMPLILMLLGVLAIAGCSTPKPAPQVIPKAPADKRVKLSPALQSSLQVLKVEPSRSHGYYGVQINFQNVTKDLKRISYRVDWLNDAGDVLHLPAGRVVPWIILGHEAASLTITSPSPLAKDFNIEFFEAGP